MVTPQLGGVGAFHAMYMLFAHVRSKSHGMTDHWFVSGLR